MEPQRVFSLIELLARPGAVRRAKRSSRFTLSEFLLVSAILAILHIGVGCGQTRLAAGKAGGASPGAAPAADKDNGPRLQALAAEESLLKAPAGVAGDFTVAKRAPEIYFGILPKQWPGAKLWSAWGDAVWASNGKIYTSTGDHDAPFGHSYVYEIDPRVLTMRLVVDVNAVLGLTDKKAYAPGKIHAPIIDGGDGWLYFVTYRGSVRYTTATEKYQGDFLLRCHLKSGRTENLGALMPHASVPVLKYHAASKSLYGLSVFGKTMPDPKNQFFVYDLARRQLVFTAESLCRANRAIFVAGDGRAYMGARHGFLHRYDPRTKRVEKTKAKIPGDGILRAASRAGPHGVAYGISKDGVVFAFDFGKETVREITKVFVAGPQYTTVCRLDPTGRYLYYVPGSHGRSRQQGSAVIELDVRTGKRKVLAFLHQAVSRQKQYNLGGSFGIALQPDGGRLFIHWNGGLSGRKKNDFGLNAVMLLNISN